MIRFIKNLYYGLCHAGSTNGRDSRQAYCDITKGVVGLLVISVGFVLWQRGPVRVFLQDWLLLSDTLCWIAFLFWILFLFATYACCVMRRWQDLDIRIPPEESFAKLIKRPRFYEVLATEEGSRETNQYGPAPKENPVPLISESDLRKAITKKLFVDLYDAERIK